MLEFFLTAKGLLLRAWVVELGHQTLSRSCTALLEQLKYREIDFLESGSGGFGVQPRGNVANPPLNRIH